MRTLHPTFVAAIAGLLTLFVWAPAAEAIIIVEDQDLFPIPGSIYRSQNGTTFPTTVPTEILSMDLSGAVGPLDSVALPPLGQTFQVDSFFDVVTELRVGGNNFTVDSFFDITYRITGAGGTSTTGSWDTEMVSMSLTGDAGGTPIVIRESPTTLPSPGGHSVTDLGNGTFQVDSFFDVFTELSLDGGVTFSPAASPIRLQLTGILPEPTSAVLVVSGILGVLITGCRKARL